MANLRGSDVKWKKTSDVAIEKSVSIGFINARNITAKVWTYERPEPDWLFSALVEGEGVHAYRGDFKSVNAAKKWATKLFNEICNRF